METENKSESSRDVSKEESTDEVMEGSSLEFMKISKDNVANTLDDFLKHERGMNVLDQNLKIDSVSGNKSVTTSTCNLLNIDSNSNSSAISCEDELIKAKQDKVSDGLNEVLANSGDNLGNEDKAEQDMPSCIKTTLREGNASELIRPVLDDEGNELIEDLVKSVGNQTNNKRNNEHCEVGHEPSEANNTEQPEEWADILGSGHLLKKILKPGIPNSRPQKSDVCILNIIGRLEDGTVVECLNDHEINLNDYEVVQGLDISLALMDKGEKAEIKVTPRFAYGSLGKKPEIPPDTNLIYTVELLDVKEEPQISTLSVAERIKIGLKKKERGNWWYSRDENTLAITCYRRALDYFDDTDIPEPHSDEEVHQVLEERLKTYNNMGAAQMKISAFDAALMSFNNVITAQPKNVKALFRKSKILKEKGDLQESIDTIKQGLSHEPDNQALQQELSSLIAAQRKANSKQRELYKKMLGNKKNNSLHKNNSCSDDEDEKKSKNNYKTITVFAVIGFAVAVLSTIAVKYIK